MTERISDMDLEHYINEIQDLTFEHRSVAKACKIISKRYGINIVYQDVEDFYKKYFDGKKPLEHMLQKTKTLNTRSTPEATEKIVTPMLPRNEWDY